MIRLFAAVGIPETLRVRLGFMQGGVPGARWVPPDNFHITLRFIGEVDETVANDIDGMLAGLRSPAFDLRLRGAGEFGGREAHSLWVGVAANEALSHLAAKIETALQRMGLAPETRKFTPHVTLARLKEPPQPRLRDFIAGHAGFDSGPFPVSTFGLYSSHKTSRGSLYVQERTYDLVPRD